MKKFFVSFALAVLVAATFVFSASAQTQIITDDDIARATSGSPVTDNWMLFTRDTGDGQFILGPATPPSGTGSLQLSTTTSNDKVWLFNYDHISTSLSSIDALGYSTYRTFGNGYQVASINIEVDVNGPDAGGYAVLVFEPVYNTSQGTVQDGVWQTWDAFNSGQAIWWSSRAIPGVCAFDCFVTWNSIIAANPGAIIIGGFGVNQGGGNPALLSAVDNLVIGKSGSTSTYNFERDTPPVYTMPTNKEECKNGGWRNFNPPTGPFPNQGLCVASTVRAN